MVNWVMYRVPYSALVTPRAAIRCAIIAVNWQLTVAVNCQLTAIYIKFINCKCFMLWFYEQLIAIIAVN